VANPVQVFNDSDLGVATAISLHTLGALGFLGGIAAYLVWHRGLRHGHDVPRLLRGAAFTTYFSIGVNLLGGFLRTFESDHPDLELFPRSPWVQAIVIKHVFLFAAMGAAVLLFERVAPRARRAAAEGTLAKAGTQHRILSAVALTGIGVAALLGAVSQVVAEFPADAAPQTPMAMHDLVAYQNFTGTWSGTPATPAQVGRAFSVPENASFLSVTFDLGMVAQAQETLTEPDGTQHTFQASATGQTATYLFQHPAAGAWSVTLSAPLVNASTWSISVKTTVPGAMHEHT